MKKGQKKKTSSTRNSTAKKNTTDNMKYEIANEFGVSLGPNSTSRANGSVGGEITKRLVNRGKGGSAKRNS
ncbi:MAG: alpha/beta-type small acid-soluble spore protein [Bacilli bacterium]|nr:alpha/beta-type small acid-soluble spore protein [Bacilli bacterium]